MKIPYLKKWHIVIFGIILFFSIVLFAAPRIGRLYIIKHSNDLIGRGLDIDRIRFNYFTGTLRIHGLVLYEKDSKTAFLSFKKLKINLDYLPLLKDEIFVKYISLDDPYVQVLQNGSEFNFSDLTESDSTVVKTDTVPSQPTKYILNNIQISKGYVKYTDVPLNHTIAMDNLDLLIPGFTWNSDSTNLDVDFKFVDGGGFYSSLALNQADSTYSVNVRLDSLNLDIIEPYVQSNMHISVLHGYLSNDVLIKGSMQSVMQLFISGVNHIYGFELVDTLKRTILSFKDLTVDIDTVQLDKSRISLNYIGLTDPFILFEMIDTTNNWFALLKPSVGEQPDSLQQQADTNAVTNEGSYSFSRLQITGGKVQFADKTLRYPFDYSIDNIQVESTTVPDIPGKLQLHASALLNGTGNFTTDVVLNPSDLTNMDINLSIGQFRMKDLDAYFKHYFGFPVSGGIMNFRTENEIRVASLISNNSLYFRKFRLAESMHTESEYHIPLRLALGVLSDKNGIIDLKAPVESHGEEVKIKNLGKIVFRIIGNLFVKAAVSPFNLLAGNYKVDPATLQVITLGLFETIPDEKSMKSVDILADILTNKPGLNTDFYFCLDRNAAADSLAYLLAREDYIRYSRSMGDREKNVADSTLMTFLRGKISSGYLETNSDVKTLCRKYIGDESLNIRLDSIRKLQTGFLKSYLNRDKGIPDDRFRIFDISPDTIKPLPDFAIFRTYFNAGSQGTAVAE
jgi:hypothetical protein